MNTYSLTQDLYYVGVNDRHTHLFENMLPLPYGVSYNSYLLIDDKTVLIDTVESQFADSFLENVKSVLGNRSLDYLVVNHMEPDHSSGIKAIRALYPNVKVVGNSKTIAMLQGFYGVNSDLLEVKEGDVLELGKHRLRFYMTPMVHWPEVMMAYEETEEILFSADAFGCFGTLDGAVLDKDLDLDKYYQEMYRYYANIVGKYGNPVQAALKKLGALSLKMICTLHGPVWTDSIAKTVGIYDQLSKYQGQEGVVIVYGSMYGHTEKMAEAVARGAMKYTKKVILHDVSKTDVSQILSDIFKYKGVIIGSATYCNALYPNISSLVEKIELRGLKNRVFAAFGNFTWAGATIKPLEAFATNLGWTLKSSYEVKQGLQPNDYEQLMTLGGEVAQAVISQPEANN